MILNRAVMQLCDQGSLQPARKSDVLDCTSKLIDFLVVDSTVNWLSVVGSSGVIGSWTGVMRLASRSPGNMARVAWGRCSATEVDNSPSGAVRSYTDRLLQVYAAFWLAANKAPSS